MISCQLYDYIELACLYHLPIELTLNSGEVINGRAISTSYNEHKEECLLMHTDKGEIFVNLEKALEMKALIENPHFTRIQFTHNTL